ncbi:MAG: class F sortase [Hyphomicrobiales bacterium]
MMWRWLPALLFCLGLLAAGLAVLPSEAAPTKLPKRAVLPVLVRGEEFPTPTPTPTPTPRPPVYDGPVSSLYLASANLRGQWPIQEMDTYWTPSGEVFQDPPAPQVIAHYRRFGNPGRPGTNSIFAAHVNYVGFGSGPFASLTSATPGDALYVRMADGSEYAYTVRSVVVVPLDWLDMNAVVYPPLDAHTERVTLISCGGTFIPFAVGGEYTSRVILVAERWVP